MTDPILPAAGGAYERLPDGTLRLIEATGIEDHPAAAAPDDVAAKAGVKPGVKSSVKEA